MPSRPKKRISRHKKKSKSYQRFYNKARVSASKKPIRRIPHPDELRMIPYEMTDALRRMAGKVPALFPSTKFCKRMYVGCTDPFCAFAHSDATARWTPAYAMEDVAFVHPPDSFRMGHHARAAVPMHGPHVGKQFVVRLSDDSEEDEKQDEPVTFSLTEMEREQAAWLRLKQLLAHDRRFLQLKKRYVQEMGEKDMEISDESDSDSDSGSDSDSDMDLEK